MSAALAANAASSLGCSPIELPAPAAPERDVPVQAQHLGTIAPGRQWVVIDTPSDRAQVQVLKGTTTETDAEGGTYTVNVTKDLCVTPCATDLRKGKHQLFLTSKLDGRRTDNVEVDLGDSPLVVREVFPQLARGRAFGPGIGLIIGGGSLMLPGAALAISGAATGTSDPVGRGLLIGGAAALGTGAVLLTVGLVLQYVGRGTHTSGAQTIFTIPALTAPTSLLDAPTGPPALVRF